MAQVDFSWDADCSFADSHQHDLLAEAMGVSRDVALATIVKLFCRVRRAFPNGDISKMPEATLKEWGRNDRLTFAALAKSEWLDVFDGDLFNETSKKILHGWPERKYVERDEQRAAAAKASRERVARWRENQRRGASKRNGGCNARCNAIVRHDDEVEVDVDDELHPPVGPPPTGRPATPGPAPAPQVLRRAATPSRDAEGRSFERSGLSDRVISFWNGAVSEIGGAMTPAKKCPNPKRDAHAARAVREGLLDRLNDVMAGLKSDPSLQTGGRNGWRPTLTWLLVPGRWQEYAERGTAPPCLPCGPPVQAHILGREPGWAAAVVARNADAIAAEARRRGVDIASG